MPDTFEGLYRTALHFADDFTDDRKIVDHCDVCGRRLVYGECPFCEAD